MYFKARLVAGQTLSGLAYGFWLATAGIYFIDKGLELWMVGLILGLSPVVTAALEVPFGMLADRHGRLRIYRLSVLIILIDLAMLSLFHSVPMFIAASVLGGIGQALQSGSLDAWYVQQLNQRGKGEKLEILSGHLQAAMAAGMVVAAIAGGYTPDFMPNFMGISGTQWNPLIASGVLMAVLLLSYGLYFEGENHHGASAEDAPHQSIGGILRGALRKPFVAELLLVGVLAGASIAAIDLFWQPRLREIAPDISYAIFGWMTFGYFAAAILGPLLIGQIAKAFNISPRRQMRLIPLGFFGVILALGFIGSVPVFVPVYLAFMLLFSMLSPATFTLINEASENHNRSAMQSLTSLTFTLGAGTTALGLSWILRSSTLSALWIGITLTLGKNLYMRRFAEPEIEASD